MGWFAEGEWRARLGLGSVGTREQSALELCVQLPAEVRGWPGRRGAGAALGAAEVRG